MAVQGEAIVPLESVLEVTQGCAPVGESMGTNKAVMLVWGDSHAWSGRLYMFFNAHTLSDTTEISTEYCHVYGVFILLSTHFTSEQ